MAIWNDPWPSKRGTSLSGRQGSPEWSLQCEIFNYFPLSIVMTMGKWHQSFPSSWEEFHVITLHLKIVSCLQKERGGGALEIRRKRDRVWCCMQTPHRCRREQQQKEQRPRAVRLCCAMLTTVGNEGAWLLPPKLQGQEFPRRLQLIEMEIQEVMLQRRGNVSLSPCQSVCLFILWCFITVTFCSY